MCHMIEYKLHRITSQQSGFVPAFTTTKGKQGMEQVELTIASSCKSSKNRITALLMKFLPSLAQLLFFEITGLNLSQKTCILSIKLETLKFIVFPN